MLAKPSTNMKPEMSKTLVLCLIYFISVLTPLLQDGIIETLSDSRQTNSMRSSGMSTNLTMSQGFENITLVDMGKHDRVTDTLIDDEGNIFVTGWFPKGTTYSIAGFSPSTNSNSACFLLKLNSNRSVEWFKQYNGSGQGLVCSSMDFSPSGLRIVALGKVSGWNAPSDASVSVLSVNQTTGYLERVLSLDLCSSYSGENRLTTSTSGTNWNENKHKHPIIKVTENNLTYVVLSDTSTGSSNSYSCTVGNFQSSPSMRKGNSFLLTISTANQWTSVRALGHWCMDDETVVAADLIPETEEIVALVKGAPDACTSSPPSSLAGGTPTSHNHGIDGCAA